MQNPIPGTRRHACFAGGGPCQHAKLFTQQAHEFCIAAQGTVNMSEQPGMARTILADTERLSPTWLGQTRLWPSALGWTTSHMTSARRNPGRPAIMRWNIASRNDTLCATETVLRSVPKSCNAPPGGGGEA